MSDESESFEQDDEPIEWEVDGTLDLHLFRPNETKVVVEEYIWACRERGITELRIVHGKGKGVQRDIVRGILSKHPDVVSFRHEDGSGGGWGATVVDIRAKE